MTKQVWTNSDFEQMSWHDNTVHGLSIREGENGVGEIELDIDHILEWRELKEGKFSFLVSPAKLIFHEVGDLVLKLDYKTPSAGITPFSISEIIRTVKTYRNGYETYQWEIEVHWPNGTIEFVASSFTQNLVAQPIETESQSLEAVQRNAFKP